MPWSGSSFAHHNHSLTGPQSGHAARIANAVLRRTGNEGESIAVANKYFQKRDDGGGIVDPAGQEVGGVAPTNQTMSPLERGMIQRYSSLPPEKLQELAVMMGGSPQGKLIQQLLARKRMMPNEQYQQTPERASGGLTPQGSPYWSRAQQRSENSGLGATGYLHGPTSGRADEILTTAPAGSHVIPADVMSGMGEGNSLAGANVMAQMLKTGPGGMQMPQSRGRNLMPSPPRPPAQQAAGGRTEQRPVALSHGEFVITPEQVRAFGGGDQDKGHAFWDWFITEARKLIIEQMKKLPPPVGMKRKGIAA
jgi:hypothetical protein